MSGLAAVFCRDGRQANRADVDVMLEAAPYRGPDGTRVFVSDPVAVGHGKMAVTSEEEGTFQPLISSTTGCAISADVRLDNRTELIARLSVSPSASDAELILRAYEEWGIDAPEHLLGDFAFIIWDPRNRRLVCARDTSGSRGLFYRVTAETFTAASEIHQLLQDPSVPIRPNDEFIKERLVPINAFRNEKDSPSTYFEGIYAVPAGHVLTVDADQLHLHQYWNLTPQEEIRYQTDDEYAEHFQDLFFQAVSARLRSSRPVGVMLSGGLDSSSIACTAQQLYRTGRVENHGFASFSFVFDGLECDERPLIEDMQDMYGFDAHYVSPDTYGGRLEMDPHGFRPTPNYGVPETYRQAAEIASRVGVRVMLSGDLGDDCMYGSRLVFDWLIRRGDLQGLIRNIGAYRRSTEYRESLGKILLMYCAAPLLPLRHHRQLLVAYHRRASQKYFLPNWMTDPLRSHLRDRDIALTLREQAERMFSSETRELIYRSLYPPQVTRHPAPWPFETARPFSDRRLHEFLLGIPSDQFFRLHSNTDDYYAGSKVLLRNAMRGILPESIRTRTRKTVFEDVWRQELEKNWSIYEVLFGARANPEIAQRGYVNRDLFWDRLLKARAGDYGPDMIQLIGMAELESWLRSLRQPRSEFVRVLPPAGKRLGDGSCDTVGEVLARAV